MNKPEVYQYLTQHDIAYEITEHEAVFYMDEQHIRALPYPDCVAKNLLIRDDKKQHYYLLAVKGDKRLDLKQFRKQHDLRPLSFASSEELLSILQVSAGTVTPLAVLNDTQHRVHVYLDSAFIGGKIGVHPNDNTATVWMQADDLIELIRTHGNPAEFTPL